MKTAIPAIVCLLVGCVVGGLLARQEFAHEVLPIALTPAGAKTGGDKQTRSPRVTVVSGERYDFGEMDQAATMTHVFEIRNDGDAVLALEQLHVSCKCTSALLEKKELKPGETTRVTMKWDAKGAVEPFEQYAEYKTNDPLRPKFKLSVAGRILETLRAEPREAIFNRVLSKEAAQARLKIYGVRETEMQILKHEFTNASTASHFSVQFVPLTPADLATRPGFKCGLEVIVDLQPGLPLGQINQALKITTNLNPEAEFEIPIYGSVVSDISLLGPGVTSDQMLASLNSFPSSRGAKSTIYLVVKGPHRENTTFKIGRIVPSDELKVSIGEPLRNNSQILSYPVTLEVPPGTPPVSRLSSGSRVEVQIETTHPHVKTLSIYVKYAVVN